MSEALRSRVSRVNCASKWTEWANESPVKTMDICDKKSNFYRTLKLFVPRYPLMHGRWVVFLLPVFTYQSRANGSCLISQYIFFFFKCYTRWRYNSTPWLANNFCYSFFFVDLSIVTKHYMFFFQQKSDAFSLFRNWRQKWQKSPFFKEDFFL